MSVEGTPQQERGAFVRARPQSHRARSGPYLLFVPLALTVAAVWWIRHPATSLVPMRPPARVDPESTHAVLGGEVSLGGATLAFWLAPSEPDPERQLFQARALRQRYSLSEGEPWRLRLEWRPPDAAQTGAAGAKLDLDGLRIVDDDGPALAPLNLARELDPLATLLAPPKDPLLVGTSLDLFLWGREPRLNPRLAGIQTPRESSTATAATLEVSLTSRALRMGDLVGPMARLDLPAQASNTNAEWKRAGAGASALPVQGTDDARY